MFFSLIIWLNLSLLDLILKIIELGNSGTESIENECDKECGTGQHEVSFGHVEFSIISIKLKVILSVFSSN